jgi:hypothetical protein
MAYWMCVATCQQCLVACENTRNACYGNCDMVKGGCLMQAQQKKDACEDDCYEKFPPPPGP